MTSASRRLRGPDPARRPHLGISAGEFDGQWFAKYWNPRMAALPEHVREALDEGAQAPPLSLSLDDVPALAPLTRS